MAGTEVDNVFVYLRISEDRTGQEAGVERQREDCLLLANRLNIGVGEVFMDNDISAYGDKKRPEYLALLERVRTGPSRIVVWHVDRLYRKPRELEDLIDLVESHPIRIESVMGGAFDLNTHEGRLMARQLVSMAAYESGHKADRIRRANRQKAERGDWHGSPRFGYGPGGVLIPSEAPVVREMADRFLAGDSLYSITRWLNDESGHLPPLAKTCSTSGVWHATTVRSILTSARISGQRAYDPGWKGAEPASGREILGPGNWKAIITPEETARIRSIMGRPERRTSKSSQTLLSAIATCGRCGAGLVAGTNRPVPGGSIRTFYKCKKINGYPERGGLVVSRIPLDELLAKTVIERLAATRMPAVIAGTNSAVGLALEQITAARHRMEDMARDYGAGNFSRGEYLAARAAAQASIEEAERVLSRKDKTAAFKGIPLGDRRALESAWDGWTVPRRRAILSTLIDTLVVNPNLYCGSKFRPERVELIFKV